MFINQQIIEVGKYVAWNTFANIFNHQHYKQQKTGERAWSFGFHNLEFRQKLHYLRSALLTTI